MSGHTVRVESADEPLTLALVKDALAERFGIEMQPHYVFFWQQTIVDNDYAVLPPGAPPQARGPKWLTRARATAAAGQTVYMVYQFGVSR